MDLIDKHILDATCGSRTIWFQKNHPMAVYMDCREEHGTAIWKSTKNDSVRTLDVEPDVLADFTDMPFDDNSFELVVFDPPHLVKVGENAWLKRKYGKLPKNWENMIHDGFWECMRVLKPYGTLVFKWSEVDIPTRRVIDAIGCEPLFGHRSGMIVMGIKPCSVYRHTEPFNPAKIAKDYSVPLATTGDEERR